MTTTGRTVMVSAAGVSVERTSRPDLSDGCRASRSSMLPDLRPGRSLRPVTHWLWFLVVLALGGVLGPVVGRLTSRQYQKGGKVECAIRSIESAGSPTTPKWRHGLANFEPGIIHFRPGGPVGLRIPHGETITIPVEQMSSDTSRRTRLRQAWSIRPGMQIVTVKGRGLTTELAAPAEALRLIRRATST